MRLYPDGRVEHLGRPEHQLRFLPGTRLVSGATVTFARRPGAGGRDPAAAAPRARHRLRLRRRLAARDVPGRGARRAAARLRHHREPTWCRSRAPSSTTSRASPAAGDGEVGYGLLEVMTMGPHPQYFTGWDDLRMTGLLAAASSRSAGGVWSVPVVVPDNPIGWTQAYVLESLGRPVPGRHRLERRPRPGTGCSPAWLAVRYVASSDVQGVLVTHHHPDHLGLAGRVREAVRLLGRDARGRHRPGACATASCCWTTRRSCTPRPPRLLVEAGATGCEVDADPGRRAARCGCPLPPLPDRAARQRDARGSGTASSRLIHTPGHTPGHLCLYLEDGDLLLTGDHLLSTITSHVGLYGFETDEADPLADYLGVPAPARRAGAGGGPARPPGRFHGVQARVDVLVGHHEERLAEIKERARRRTASRPGSCAGS